MKIIPYDREKKAEIFAEALVVLMSGGTIVYPTETAYAIGADFFSPHGYNAVYKIKYRDQSKPLPVIVPDIAYASTLVKFTPQASELAMRYWPGPLTLVLPFLYHAEWPHHPDSFLALRVSSHPIASSLSHAFGRPLISTSANVSGGALSYSAADAVAQFSMHQHEPDLVIDAGDIPAVTPSTIIKVTALGMEVLREGAITITR